MRRRVSKSKSKRIYWNGALCDWFVHFKKSRNTLPAIGILQKSRICKGALIQCCLGRSGEKESEMREHSQLRLGLGGEGMSSCSTQGYHRWKELFQAINTTISVQIPPLTGRQRLSKQSLAKQRLSTVVVFIPQQRYGHLLHSHTQS